MLESLYIKDPDNPSEYLLTPCLEIALIVDPNCAISEIHKHFIQAYDWFIKNYGAQIKYHYKGGEGGKLNKTKPKGDALQTWLHKRLETTPEFENDIVWYQCDAGKSLCEKLAPCSDIWMSYRRNHPKDKYISIQLPIENFVNSSSEEVNIFIKKIIDEWLVDFHFYLGYISYSLCCSAARSTPSAKNIISALKAYPFFMYGDIKGYFLRNSYICPSWITFLHTSLVEKLGGIHNIKQHFENTSIHIYSLGHGVAIQIGNKPQLDNSTTNFELYKNVHQFLKPIRTTDEVGRFRLKSSPNELENYLNNEWMHRFD